MGDKAGGAGLSFTDCTGATVDHCSFNNNSVVGDHSAGGGILFSLKLIGMDTTSITNSNFSFNTARGTAAKGGGVHFFNTQLYMSKCTFTSNTVRQHFVYQCDMCNLSPTTNTHRTNTVHALLTVFSPPSPLPPFFLLSPRT